MMKRIHIVNTVFALWLVAFAASFIAPAFTAPTGDGFTRGMNRIAIWLGWQAVALVLAVGLAVYGMRLARDRKGARRLSLVPIAIQLLLVAAGVCLVVFLRLAEPAPQPDSPSTPTQAAIAQPAAPIEGSYVPPAGVKVETFSGFYKSGFEASHFYSAEGGQPWWLEARGHEWDTLQSHLVEQPGRGSSVTVAVELRGWTEADASDLAHIGRFQGKLFVVSLNSVRPLTSEQFDQVVSSLTRDDADREE